MSDYNSSDDNQPIMWLQGRAIYAAYFIVLVYVASMLITTLFMFAGTTVLSTWLPFESGRVLHGEVWRIFSYGLVNPPSPWFLIDMLMIGWFGREVERYFGRRIFLRFYAALYLLTPLLFTLIGVWLPMHLAGVTGAFALFIAMATIHPDAMMMFNIPIKWLAWALVGIYTLMAMAYHDLAGFITLWSTCGFAYAFVRYEQGRLPLPDLRFWRRKPKFRVLPDLPSAAAPKRAAPIDSSMAEMDALLDKIARSGIASLTAKERARLDQSRTELLKKKTTDRS